jgi:hypothetical protein
MSIPDSESTTGNYCDTTFKVLWVDLFGADDLVED